MMSEEDKRQKQKEEEEEEEEAVIKAFGVMVPEIADSRKKTILEASTAIVALLHGCKH